jgi:hypothetical protein
VGRKSAGRHGAENVGGLIYELPQWSRPEIGRMTRRAHRAVTAGARGRNGAGRGSAG